MKITRVEPIATGTNVFLKIETDAGITGYGDATNHFIPYSSEGMLKDLIPYLIGEDPERIEYLWQACFRRRFYRGGPATGAAISAIDMALWDIKGGVPVAGRLGPHQGTRVRAHQREHSGTGRRAGQTRCTSALSIAMTRWICTTMRWPSSSRSSTWRRSAKQWAMTST